MTPGEINRISAFLENATTPGQFMTSGAPELQGDAFYASPEAKKVLVDLIAEGPTSAGNTVTTKMVPENGNDCTPTTPGGGNYGPFPGIPGVTLRIPEDSSDSGY